MKQQSINIFSKQARFSLIMWRRTLLVIILSQIVLSQPPRGIQNENNTTVCSTSCSLLSHPCECYQDGYVDCKSKNLTAIPSPMPICTKRITISRNRITQLDIRYFQGMVNTHTMDIKDENITEIPAGVFSDLSALQELSLTNNQIQAIIECAFEGLSSLKMLQLSDNLITRIEAKSFQSLSSLQSLYLDNNLLEAIEPTLFEGLTSLQYLHLKSNRLTKIPSGALYGLTSLTSIDIYNNSFSKLDVQWFQDVNNLILLVGANPWNCTCALKREYSYILNTFNSATQVHCPLPGQGLFIELVFNQMCIQCSYPEQFAEQNLRDIPLSTFPECEAYNESTTTLTAPRDEVASTGLVELNLQNETVVPQRYCQLKVDQLKIEIRSATIPTIASERTRKTSIITESLIVTTQTVAQAKTTSEKTTKSVKNEPPLPSTNMPAWAIALIIIVILSVIATAVAITILVLRQSGRKVVSDATDNTEMQPKNFSNKSFRDDANGKPT